MSNKCAQFTREYIKSSGLTRAYIVHDLYFPQHSSEEDCE